MAGQWRSRDGAGRQLGTGGKEWSSLSGHRLPGPSLARRWSSQQSQPSLSPPPCPQEECLAVGSLAQTEMSVSIPHLLAPSVRHGPPSCSMPDNLFPPQWLKRRPGGESLERRGRGQQSGRGGIVRCSERCC